MPRGGASFRVADGALCVNCYFHVTFENRLDCDPPEEPLQPFGPGWRSM